MIEEDYVTYEVAKLLKEKGFDCPSYSHYRLDNGELCRFNTNCSTNIEPNNYITAPTLQMAMKWLREKNDIAIEINVGTGSKDCWVSNVIKDYKTENGTYMQTLVRFSYEEACEAGIRYCLQNLI